LPATTPLEHLLDLSHATLFGRAVDVGMINHQVQLLLGEALPPIRPAPQWPGWHRPEPGDLIHFSGVNDRRYIWRRRVIDAEPRDEIAITSGEIATVEQQLEAYRFDW